MNRAFSKWSHLGRQSGSVAKVEDGPRLRYQCDSAGKCFDCVGCHHAVPHKPIGPGWRNMHGPCHLTPGECGFLRAESAPPPFGHDPTVQCKQVVVGTNNGRNFPPMTEEVKAAPTGATKEEEDQ